MVRLPLRFQLARKSLDLIAPRDQLPPDSVHRHPVCGCRDFPLGSEDGSRKAREFAGCWRLRSFDSEPETGLFRGDSG
jgi:hypothetical protein